METHRLVIHWNEQAGGLIYSLGNETPLVL